MKSFIVVLFIHHTSSRFYPYEGYRSDETGELEYETAKYWEDYLKKGPSQSYKEFRKALGKVKNLLIHTGGGISEDCGVPINKDHIHRWREYNVITLTQKEVFVRNPSIIWEFYYFIREKSLKAEPSKAHLALADLEERMVKAGRNFTLMTTNIDGLHQRAGSKNVLELHGSVVRTRCTKCGKSELNEKSPICPALSGRDECLKPHQNYSYIKIQDLPHCENQSCGGLLKPDVVLYGEQIPADVRARADKAMAECDFFITIGSSLNIMPSGIWPYRLCKKGIPVAEFNLDLTKFTADFQFFFRGYCSETIPEAISRRCKRP